MKKIIIFSISGVLALSLLGGGGYWIFTLYSALGEYKELGTTAEIKSSITELKALQLESLQLNQEMEKAKTQFSSYKAGFLERSKQRAERKVATSIASFTPISGPYVLTSTAVKEYIENCEDAMALKKLEATMFGMAVTTNQSEGCKDRISYKLLPLFKYQMLRVRAGMSGSYGHFRDDAEKKFDNSRKLLQRWDIPVAKELESYTRF